jgi:hypothetical protein
VLTLVIGWKIDKLAASTIVGPAWAVLELHSSDSHCTCWEVELALDACEAASENTEEVEEEAEEERVAAYGWVSGRRPKCWGRISMLMMKRRVVENGQP